MRYDTIQYKRIYMKTLSAIFIILIVVAILGMVGSTIKEYKNYD